MTAAHYVMNLEYSTRTSSQVGFYTAIFTTLITLVTLGFAIISHPDLWCKLRGSVYPVSIPGHSSPISRTTAL